MAHTWDDTEAKCPFYRSSDRGKREIVCESSNVSAAVQGMRFADMDGFTQQLRLYCDDVKNCRRCEQYRAIVNLRYAGEDPL